MQASFALRLSMVGRSRTRSTRRARDRAFVSTDLKCASDRFRDPSIARAASLPRRVARERKTAPAKRAYWNIMPLIRAGGQEDLAQIQAIQAASPEASQWDPSDYLSYDLRVVVEDDGSIVGFAVSRRTAPDECELLNLAIAPAFRRRGAARRLVQSIIESFQTMAGLCVFLEVRESNMAARAFYKSLNFQEVTKRQNYYNQPIESAIVMKFHSC